MTWRCNLACRHCYADGESAVNESSINDEDALDFLRMLERESVPALLLSGGEPLLHPSFFAFLAEAASLGLKVAVSTNGALVDEEAAGLLSRHSSYVGISIDGPREIHDGFRGVVGAFDASLKGIKFLAEKGCRIGLRVTLARPLIKWLDEIFAIAASLPLSRICFYHFIPSGRGANDNSLIPDEKEEDSAVRRIIEWAEMCGNSGASRKNLEILTVGDSSDSVRLYKYLELKSDGRLARAVEWMRRAAEKAAGMGILSVRWDGAVFRNQFSWGCRLGGWKELGDIARSAGEKDELADVCVSCVWARKICRGRILGFGKKCTLREVSE
jgi:MoaA/NifB/PqqE/SkfB family radical SAM enzyme